MEILSFTNLCWSSLFFAGGVYANYKFGKKVEGRVQTTIDSDVKTILDMKNFLTKKLGSLSKKSLISENS
jgi:hypothetical protein